MDAGLLALFLGLVSLLKPLRFLGIGSRAAGSIVLGCGFLIVIFTALLPARLQQPAGPRSLLDSFVPAFQFHEVHSTRINASPAVVFQAVKNVTPSEIHLYRAITWLRSPHFGSAPPGILNAPPAEPILEAATHSGFMTLAEDPNREIVFGTIAGPPLNAHNPQPADFIRFDRPGHAKIAMNFLIVPAPDGETILTTETRVFATDAGALRHFAPYWRIIFPGSSLIRVMWLAAIKRRAERPPLPLPR